MGIKLSQVSKVFFDKKNKKETCVVNKISVDIPKGKLVCLLGPSGCGKSTILYMIAGIHSISSGKIFFENKDVTNVPIEKRGIGFVFQNYALYPHMTVQQNISFPLENLKTPAKEILVKVEEIAKLVGIEEHLDKKPHELSGGQQQRVAIARALVKKPQVLLLDEPLSNLDAGLRLKTREEIRRIQRKTGITAIFVTHDQEEAMTISDEICLMKKGEIQQKGSPQEVYSNPRNLFVAKFLGNPLISIFEGEIVFGKVYLGKSLLFDFSHDKNLKTLKQKVYVAIRPEGYWFAEDGNLEIETLFLETIGRDLMLLARHPQAVNNTFRLVFDEKSKDIIFPQGFFPKQKIRFQIKQEKCFLFDPETENRIF
ncbi:ABC-type sugar transport system, ATPase component [Candidatus Phytoplasma australiense]|uniref:ABC-type sugar transport system, ATPase component n=2 Tax=Phytoplasma australiense TaxID=59748 RepID=B1V8X3_PHYAS|nr:ABC transporter ATP-binding protein [Candidatus Phytoplasma australiense]AGL89956.1 Ferric cations import ATP-binding protein fbpC [Strawberry lethal yellows phytoplasma (CPA) str. NZSb11]CAM11360.1 ABC-type sugar transport system, ATPase component [Candidatus Phytoplasma australiense]